jgi:hypothetical protein
MLVTISGVVGSGKSTTARRVSELLSAGGLEPRRLRFRFLPLFGLQPRPVRAERPSHGSDRQAVRANRRGSSPRRLTAALTLGYTARIMAFRLSRIGSGSRCDVLDRYFYDNLGLFELKTARERVFAHLLAWLVPKPDLAFLMTAAPATIASRRPGYDPESLAAVGQQYARLDELFPYLVRIDTSEQGVDEEIRRAVERLLVSADTARRRPR